MPDVPPDPSPRTDDAPTLDAAQTLPHATGSAPPAGLGAPSRLAPGDTINGFTIESTLGVGGMGVVYLARQRRPAREVALKLIRPSLATPRMLRRFEDEADLLARLESPGIARVYEMGVLNTGAEPQPFFAMEFVRGPELIRYADAKRLTADDRLRLFARLCDAAHHAHQKGVIHRDLKPSNILVTDTDDEPQPKILDFGVARALDDDRPTNTRQTEAGQLIGTLAYMSPEQVAGDPGLLDTRSDVYALGVILFELLTGRRPHDLTDTGVYEAVRTIQEKEPPRLRSIDATLPRDVETIVTTALTKDKQRRYQSASDLGAEVRRFLAREPIQARPPSAIYQARLFAARRRGLVAAMGAAAVILALGAAGTVWQAARATNQAAIAKQSEQDAIAARDAADFRAQSVGMLNRFLLDMLSAADPDLAAGRDVTVAELLDLAADDAGVRFADRPRLEALMRQTLARTYRGLGRYPAALEQAIAARDLTIASVDLNDALRIDIDRTYAIALVDAGRFDEAEAITRSAAARLAESFGADHPDHAALMADLGRIAIERGDFQAAERLIRESIDAREGVVPDDDAELLNTFNNLATMLRDQGRLAEAEELFRQCVSRHETIYGRAHPQTAYSLNGLAAVLEKLGKNDEAAELLAEVLDIRAGLLGEGHPATVTAHGNLGVALIKLGRNRDALPHAQIALDGARQLLGDEHAKTLIAMGNLAFLYENLGRLDEAESLYREVVRIRKTATGGADPETWATINNLAMMLAKRAEHAKAQELFDELLSLCAQRLPPGHYYTAIFASNRANNLIDLGRHDEAEHALLESIESLSAALGPDHARTVTARERLERARVERSRSAERH